MKLPVRLFILAGVILISYIAGTFHSHLRGLGPAGASAGAILYYRCPMHPGSKSSAPGLAPCCGMQMEPVYGDVDDHTKNRDAPTAPSGRIRVTSEKQQVVAVETDRVVKGSLDSTIRVLGRVVLDESRVFKVAPPLDGLIRKVSPSATGDFIQKDGILATYLNREVLRPQQGYIQALSALDKYQGDSKQLEAARSAISVARENLEYLGMGETQIGEIARTRKTTSEVEVRSPAAGLLLVRNAFPQTRFERGTELYRIADVTHLWILADLFENEGRLVRQVKSATIAYQGRNWPARLSRTPPLFDAASRTLKIRLEVANPDVSLRPDMFVEVKFRLETPEALTVPVDSVIDSGLKKTVYVDLGKGYFEPRLVETGWRIDNRVQIVRGLREGERIVVSGNFLIDCESRFREAAPAIH